MHSTRAAAPRGRQRARRGRRRARQRVRRNARGAAAETTHLRASAPALHALAEPTRGPQALTAANVRAADGRAASRPVACGCHVQARDVDRVRGPAAPQADRQGGPRSAGCRSRSTSTRRSYAGNANAHPSPRRPHVTRSDRATCRRSGAGCGHRTALGGPPRPEYRRSHRAASQADEHWACRLTMRSGSPPTARP